MESNPEGVRIMREFLILLFTVPGFIALAGSSENWGHAIPFGLVMVGLLSWSIAARVRKAGRRSARESFYRPRAENSRRAAR